jgi:hypothetical protein
MTNAVVPQNLDKAWPDPLIIDAFRKSRTRDKSPMGVTAGVCFDNNALWIG